MRKPPEEIVYTEGNGFEPIRDNVVVFPKRPKGDESMSDDHGKGHGHDHGGHGKKEAGLMPDLKKVGLGVLAAILGLYAIRFIIIPMIGGIACDLTGNVGCQVAAKMNEQQTMSADSSAPFSVNREIRRREGGPVGPARRQQGRQGLMPSVDCAAMGGIRTTNPNTGMPSCFVPN
ncbi:hypothetical protein JNK62_02835 [bacterium]|jgi:hypothetical protein|nr:hypothetical protein [bacterium]